jgi:hypothetical protein
VELETREENLPEEENEKKGALFAAKKVIASRIVPKPEKKEETTLVSNAAKPDIESLNVLKAAEEEDPINVTTAAKVDTGVRIARSLQLAENVGKKDTKVTTAKKGSLPALLKKKTEPRPKFTFPLNLKKTSCSSKVSRPESTLKNMERSTYPSKGQSPLVPLTRSKMPDFVTSCWRM